MICPYCMHELVVADFDCPRCNTAYAAAPHASLGLKVRKFACIGAAVFVTTIVLTHYVLPDLPGGRNSPWGHGKSRQQSLTPPPDYRSPDLNRLLATWGNHLQANGSAPAIVGKH